MNIYAHILGMATGTERFNYRLGGVSDCRHQP